MGGAGVGDRRHTGCAMGRVTPLRSDKHATITPCSYIVRVSLDQLELIACEPTIRIKSAVASTTPRWHSMARNSGLPKRFTKSIPMSLAASLVSYFSMRVPWALTSDFMMLSDSACAKGARENVCGSTGMVWRGYRTQDVACSDSTIGEWEGGGKKEWERSHRITCDGNHFRPQTADRTTTQRGQDCLNADTATHTKTQWTEHTILPRRHRNCLRVLFVAAMRPTIPTVWFSWCQLKVRVLHEQEVSCRNHRPREAVQPSKSATRRGESSTDESGEHTGSERNRSLRKASTSLEHLPLNFF